jgi:uncharacterized protein YjbI with pentapeptide repeats
VVRAHKKLNTMKNRGKGRLSVSRRLNQSTEASLGNILFENSNLDLSAFNYASLKQVRFDNCSLLNADYYECKLNKVKFYHCDLNEINFARTPLKGVDISSSTYQRITVLVEDLVGCVVLLSKPLVLRRC